MRQRGPLNTVSDPFLRGMAYAHPSDLTLKMYACSYLAVSTSFYAQVLLCTHFYATSPVTYLPQRHNSVLDSRLR
jgi:hypothetical protein